MRAVYRFACVLVAAVAAPASAQGFVRLQLTEVLVDPIGPDKDNQLAEVQNTGNVPIDTTGWYLVAGTSAIALPGVQLPPGQVARLHFGPAGLNTMADLYLPQFRQLTTADTLVIYRSSQFSNPADLEDFVSWGGGQGRIQEAVAAGQWPSTLVTVALPAGEGQTIAHYVDAAFGSGETEDDWYQDTTPTVGLPNDPGKIFGAGVGCAGSPASLGLARPESRPWIGQRWEIDAYNLPPAQGVGVMLIGARGSSPQSLAAAGLPGCSLHLWIDLALPFPHSGGGGVFAASIPNNPWLVRQPLYLQAFVVDPAAGNPIGGWVTNAAVIYFGSK